MRPEMEMEKDDVLEQLRAELMAVGLSPGFAVGVRARVEARGGAWMRPTLALLLTTAAVAVLAGGVLWVSGHDAVVPAVVRPVAQTAAPSIAPAPSVMPATKASAPRRAAASVTPAVVAAAETSSGPFLEVITNQPAMIRRMRSRFTTKALFDPFATADVNEPITVAPIVVSEIEVPSIGGVVIKKGVRWIGNDESVRSAR